MSQLFERSASIYIGQKKATEAIVIDATFRITFDIKKTKSTYLTPNTAKIEIYNLSKQTRDFIQPIKGLCLVRAGYGTNQKDIFKGSIVRSYHSKRPPDIITTLECLDGYDIINGVPQSFGFSPGSSAKSLLNSVLSSMKVDKGASNIGDVIDKHYATGFSFTGRGIEAIDRICNYLNIEYSIQNNAIKLCKKGKSDNTTVDEISADTGMLDSPTMIANADEKNPTQSNLSGWQVKALLRPYLEPHNRIQIDSPMIPKAQYIIQTIQHSGDTRGNDWTTIIDAIEAK
mgnify:CR=1 FL=1